MQSVKAEEALTSSILNDEPRTLLGWALLVLQTSDTDAKAQLTQKAAQLWNEVQPLLHFFFTHPCADLLLGCVKGVLSGENLGEGKAIMRPARPSTVQILPPSAMPKRGKAGSLANRIAMLHSLVHIESMVSFPSLCCKAIFHD